MKKRIFSLVVALAMLATSFSTTIHAADDEKNVQALNPQYTYENNGYTLEKISHADVKAGETDGFVDYYQYTIRMERSAPALSSTSTKTAPTHPSAIPRQSSLSSKSS